MPNSAHPNELLDNNYVTTNAASPSPSVLGFIQISTPDNGDFPMLPLPNVGNGPVLAQSGSTISGDGSAMAVLLKNLAPGIGLSWLSIYVFDATGDNWAYVNGDFTDGDLTATLMNLPLVAGGSGGTTPPTISDTNDSIILPTAGVWQFRVGYSVSGATNPEP